MSNNTSTFLNEPPVSYKRYKKDTAVINSADLNKLDYVPNTQAGYLYNDGSGNFLYQTPPNDGTNTSIVSSPGQVIVNENGTIKGLTLSSNDILPSDTNIPNTTALSLKQDAFYYTTNNQTYDIEPIVCYTDTNNSQRFTTAAVVYTKQNKLYSDDNNPAQVNTTLSNATDLDDKTYIASAKAVNKLNIDLTDDISKKQDQITAIDTSNQIPNIVNVETILNDNFDANDSQNFKYIASSKAVYDLYTTLSDSIDLKQDQLKTTYNVNNEPFTENVDKNISNSYSNVNYNNIPSCFSLSQGLLTKQNQIYESDGKTNISNIISDNYNDDSTNTIPSSKALNDVYNTNIGGISHRSGSFIFCLPATSTSTQNSQYLGISSSYQSDDFNGYFIDYNCLIKNINVIVTRGSASNDSNAYCDITLKKQSAVHTENTENDNIPAPYNIYSDGNGSSSSTNLFTIIPINQDTSNDPVGNSTWNYNNIIYTPSTSTSLQQGQILSCYMNLHGNCKISDIICVVNVLYKASATGLTGTYVVTDDIDQVVYGKKSFEEIEYLNDENGYNNINSTINTINDNITDLYTNVNLKQNQIFASNASSEISTTLTDEYSDNSTIKIPSQYALNAAYTNLETQITPLQTNSLTKQNNLSDLNSASTARTNLGLGNLAIQNVSDEIELTKNLIITGDGTAPAALDISNTDGSIVQYIHVEKTSGKGIYVRFENENGGYAYYAAGDISNVNTVFFWVDKLGRIYSNNTSASQYCKTDSSNRIASTATIPNTDITGLGNLSVLNDSSVITWSGASSTFTNSPIFSSTTASQYLKTDANKKLTNVSTIPNTDITGLGSFATISSLASTSLSDTSNLARLDQSNIFTALNGGWRSRSIHQKVGTINNSTGNTYLNFGGYTIDLTLPTGELMLYNGSIISYVFTRSNTTQSSFDITVRKGNSTGTTITDLFTHNYSNVTYYSDVSFTYSRNTYQFSAGDRIGVYVSNVTLTSPVSSLVNVVVYLEYVFDT